ncbi:Phenolic glucoside malonyltransferase [Actinidia chinensis var. chinensis]|uniref:Phenolic glucoside malonyltransferase n=1 Tax=Actinidia chinensis var. chinensis TaxID=1590841 RepID=A0A2R6P9P1_ACTCC|nr:Phenolic glucoside malonyltransferase [Actinidia chinensis var. chinensis]
MAPPCPVIILDDCRVAPTPSSTAQMSLPLTFFDVFWLKLHPNQRLFFYEASHQRSTFAETVLPKLKHSLAVTLQRYLPLAGNLIWSPDSDKPIIQYIEGDTVSLTIAESEADFYHLLSNSFREAKEYHPFLPSLLASNTRVPVLALQVTLFPNTGFSIGYATHHAVLDGKTTAMFMQSWASISRFDGDLNPTLELSPFYDRTIIHDPADLERAYLKGWLEHNGPSNKSLVFWDSKAPPDMMIGTFRLTRGNIENIKNWVQTQWQKKHQQKPAIPVSSFAITSAYIWVCLVKARQLRSKKVHLAFNIDCRARLDIPSTYFGNCITFRVLEADSDELIGENGVAIAVKAISDAIGGLNDGLLKGAEELISRLLSVQEEKILSIAGSPRFEFYNTDFGWGRSRKVELISVEKSGAISLLDSREGIGGIEIGVALKKHEIEAFASLFASGLEAHQVLETFNHS